MRSVTSSRYRRHITRYGTRIAILSEANDPRTPDACDGATGTPRQWPTRANGRFDYVSSDGSNRKHSSNQAAPDGTQTTELSPIPSDVAPGNCESQGNWSATTLTRQAMHGPVRCYVCRALPNKCLDDAHDRRHSSPSSAIRRGDRPLSCTRGEAFFAVPILAPVIDVTRPHVRRSRSWYPRFDRIENGRVPVVAVLHAASSGGFVELAARHISGR